MRSQYEVGEVVEWRELDAEGNPVGDPLVIRYTAEGKEIERPRSGSGGSLSRSREETRPMEAAVDPAAWKRNPEQPRGQPGIRPSVGGPLLKTEEAAKYLAISPRQVQYLSKGGKLPCVRMGKSTRYTQADLDDFVGRHRRSGGKG